MKNLGLLFEEDIMNKKQVLSLTGVTLATVGGVSVANETVKADTNVISNTAQAQTQQTADQQAQVKVDQAQSNVNSASQAVNNAQSQLTSANAANSAAQKAVTD